MSSTHAEAVTDTPAARPGPRDPTETFHLSAADGVGLYGEWFAAAQPRALALVMHGYAEHCGRYREVAHVLTGAGVSALTYDMRGHGRADGQRGHCASYRDYLRDMQAALAELSRRGGARLPILLVAHSNGALVALRALADPGSAPRGVEAAVLTSPYLGLAVKVPRAKELVGLAAARLVPTLSLPSGLPIEHLTHDPDKLAERRLDTLCHEVASAGWFTASMEAQAYVLEMAQRVRVPSVWLVAGGDRIADVRATRRVHARLRAPSRYVEFPGMHHEVMNEVDRGLVFAEVRRFIDERFPRAAGAA
jgi:alpha-beta hydrolase superfamily lysophospholipase